MSFSSVAEYSRTPIDTSPNETAPFQIARISGTYLRWKPRNLDYDSDQPTPGRADGTPVPVAVTPGRPVDGLARVLGGSAGDAASASLRAQPDLKAVGV